MIPVVVDCNVVMAACGWRSEPYFCLVAMARRQVRAFITERIEEECRRVARRMEADRIFYPLALANAQLVPRGL